MRTANVTAGKSRSVQVAGLPSADYADIIIGEEDIALRFERQPDGYIRSTGVVTRYASDTADRATRDGFQAARTLAVNVMNRLQKKEEVRALGVDSSIIVSDSTANECVISYHGWIYSYTCDLRVPLTWHNLRFGGRMQGPAAQEAAPYLTAEESRKLKQRAYGKIQMRREFLGYENNGLGLLPAPTGEQGSFLFEAA